MFRRSIPIVMLVGIAILVAEPSEANAQLGETSSFLAHVSNQYREIPNMT